MVSADFCVSDLLPQWDQGIHEESDIARVTKTDTTHTMSIDIKLQSRILERVDFHCGTSWCKRILPQKKKKRIFETISIKYFQNNSD